MKVFTKDIFEMIAYIASSYIAIYGIIYLLFGLHTTPLLLFLIALYWGENFPRKIR